MKKWPSWLKGGIVGLIIGLFQPYFFIPYIVTGIFVGFIVGKITKNKPNKVVALNDPYISESHIAGFLTNQVAGARNQKTPPLTFPYASSTETINVHVYKDAEETLSDYKTFDFDYTNKTNPLLEKELFVQLEKIMKAHGLTRTKNDPQISISMDFFIGKKEQYTPPTTLTSTKLMYDWNIVSLGNSWGGMSSTVPITSSQTTPGYTTVTYYSNIRLNFLNYAKLVKGVKLEIPPMIWMGESDSEGSSPEIRGIAPTMFNELVEQFLNQTYLFSQRHINHVLYGGLGLGFKTNDWQVINHVEASSVAAEHGIKAGDQILSINGKPVGNWPNYNYPQGAIAADINYMVLYRSTDPYFQYILSNQGDKDIKLVIRSAETGKKIKLEMRPRTQERYVQIDPTMANIIVKQHPFIILFVIIIFVVLAIIIF
jgi:hypothetical protein